MPDRGQRSAVHQNFQTDAHAFQARTDVGAGAAPGKAFGSRDEFRGHVT